MARSFQAAPPVVQVTGTLPHPETPEHPVWRKEFFFSELHLKFGEYPVRLRVQLPVAAVYCLPEPVLCG